MKFPPSGNTDTAQAAWGDCPQAGCKGARSTGWSGRKEAVKKRYSLDGARPSRTSSAVIYVRFALGIAGVSWCGDLQEKDFTMLRDNGKPPGTTPPSHTTPATVQLTVKERQVLEWVAIGKSAWEISRIQGCTEATVHFHTSNIRRKFGVTSLNRPG
ncbi:Transcriptional regulator, LuxR family, partial [Pseudomonas syringae pv. rhaphiolepidis]